MGIHLHLIPAAGSTLATNLGEICGLTNLLGNPLKEEKMCFRCGPLALAVVLSVIGALVANPVSASLPVVRIGIVIDGPPTDRGHVLLVPVQQEIVELTRGEFDVRFPPKMQVSGNWSRRQIVSVIDRLLADPRVDVVIALGVISCDELAGRKTLPKPVIAPITISPELQELPVKGGASGIHNLNYLASFKSFRRDVHLFHEVVPFRRLAVLTDRLILDTVPSLLDLAAEIAAELEVEINAVAVDGSAADALIALPPKTDAVLVTPLVRMGRESFAGLVRGLIDRRLPSFSFLGSEEVEAGLLASAAPPTDFRRLARRIALNLQRILLGEDAGDLPISIASGERLTINMATARAVGVALDWRLRTEADLIGEEAIVVERHLNLTSVTREAITANLDIAAFERVVEVGEEEIRVARSALLPQLNLIATGSQIDEDRGNPLSRAERETATSLALQQLIYSDGAWANLDIQHHLQRGREEEQRRLKLDIAREATISYLDLLKAKTLERVQRENLKLIRSNLDLARSREAIGISGPADVFRWESEIASSRRAVLEAEARRFQAEVALNRLLHRPLEEPFTTQEAHLDDPSLLASDPRLLGYLKDRGFFALFRDFMVEEGLRLSPEIVRLDAAIAAQERLVVAAKRVYWLPTLALQASGNETLSRSGAGSGPGRPANDTDWQVGLSLSLPLFEGGGRNAELAQARAELSRLELERQAVQERIESRIRVALFATGASYPAIELSRQAATAARQNRELVTDAYARGVVSIIDLLDAQNASLVADQLAANAVYDFLIDMMETERAVGRFDLLMMPVDREAWFTRLATYLADHAPSKGE